MTLYKRKLFAGMGVGLVACRTIPQGTKITTCGSWTLDAEETDFTDYLSFGGSYFSVTPTKAVLPLGDISLINHSDTPNCHWYIRPDKKMGGRYTCTLYASRPIKAHEQLFIHYGEQWAQVFKKGPSLLTWQENSKTNMSAVTKRKENEFRWTVNRDSPKRWVVRLNDVFLSHFASAERAKKFVRRMSGTVQSL